MNLNPKKLVDSKLAEQPINLAQKVMATPIPASSQSMQHRHLQDASKSSVFTTLRLPTTPSRPVVGTTSIISSPIAASQISIPKPTPRHVVTTTVYPVMSLGGNGTPVPMASIIRGQTISAHTAGATPFSSHIPRGPAAVASLSAGPKSAVATPILRPTHTHTTASALQQMTIRAPNLGVGRINQPQGLKTQSLASQVIDMPKVPGSSAIVRDPTLRTAKAMHLSQPPLVQHVQQISDKGYFKSAVISSATVLQPRTCASTCVVTIAPAPSTAALRTTGAPSGTKISSVVVSPKTTVADLVAAKKGVVIANSASAASPSTIPVAKVHPQPSSVPRPVFGDSEGTRGIYIAHSSPAVVLSSSSENRTESGGVRFASLSRPGAYTVPQAAYFYESYPVQNAIPVHSYATTSSAASLRPAQHSAAASPMQSVPPTHPVMVTVDASTFGTTDTTTSTLHYTTGGGIPSGLGPPANYGPVTSHTNHNTSPRPSILRKRASDGVAVVKKNLLSSLPGSGPTSPHPDVSSTSSKPPTRLGIQSDSLKENGFAEQTERSRPSAVATNPSQTLIKTESADLSDTGAANGLQRILPLETSPRKKPRKQQLAATELLESHSTDGEEAYESVKREFSREEEEHQKCVTFCKRPSMSLLNSYRHTWKSRHNHFLRYTDVKPKDDKKCTVNELANQKGVVQKTNGWKIYHLTTQLDDVADLESMVHARLSRLLGFVESPPWKAPLPCEEEKTLVKVSDLIKGNLQRSKIAQDQVGEMKHQVVRMLEHKTRVVQIIGKYVSKRPIKKKSN